MYEKVGRKIVKTLDTPWCRQYGVQGHYMAVDLIKLGRTVVYQVANINGLIVNPTTDVEPIRMKRWYV